jgi:hypothetical protein
VYIIRNSGIYAQLIDPESDFYKQRMGKTYETGVMNPAMAREWADAYLGKFSLCRNAGLVNPAQADAVYNKVPIERRNAVRGRENFVLGKAGYSTGTGMAD